MSGVVVDQDQSQNKEKVMSHVNLQQNPATNHDLK